jgi:hypothetical protein
MPWQPGQSGNPAGRPRKGSALAELLQTILDEPWRDGPITNRERLCRFMVASACDGNMKAVAWVADRAEGRTAQLSAELGIENLAPIRILDFSAADGSGTD